MRKPFVLFLMAAASSACFAQATWKNLHYGESRDDVRAQLSGENIAVEASQEGVLQSTSDFELPLPGLRYPLPMLVNLHFTDAGALMDVTLILDVPAMRRNWGTLGADDALLQFAGERLAGALSGRYGTPIYKSPGCEVAGSAAAAYGLLSWRGEEQTVELEHSATAHGPRLVMRYQPLASML